MLTIVKIALNSLFEVTNKVQFSQLLTYLIRPWLQYPAIKHKEFISLSCKLISISDVNISEKGCSSISKESSSESKKSSKSHSSLNEKIPNLLEFNFNKLSIFNFFSDSKICATET